MQTYVNASIRRSSTSRTTVVSINRVTKVVKGGKNLSFSALVVVGDGHGVVGFGIGKAKEVPSAIKKGIEAAKKNLIRVPLAGHDDPAPDRRQLRRRQRAAEAGARRHRHHRRRRGPRGGRSGRHHQHPDQVARLGQSAQRGAGDVRRARSLKDPALIARLRGKELGRARHGERVRQGRQWQTSEPIAKGGTVKVTLAQEPDRVQPQPGRGRAGSGPAADPPHRGAEGHAGDARHDSQGAASGGGDRK